MERWNAQRLGRTPMAKALYWAKTDAERWKLGERIGLDHPIFYIFRGKYGKKRCPSLKMCFEFSFEKRNLLKHILCEVSNKLMESISSKVHYWLWNLKSWRNFFVIKRQKIPAETNMRSFFLFHLFEKKGVSSFEKREMKNFGRVGFKSWKKICSNLKKKLTKWLEMI